MGAHFPLCWCNGCNTCEYVLLIVHLITYPRGAACTAYGIDELAYAVTFFFSVVRGDGKRNDTALFSLLSEPNRTGPSRAEELETEGNVFWKVPNRQDWVVQQQQRYLTSTHCMKNHWECCCLWLYLKCDDTAPKLTGQLNGDEESLQPEFLEVIGQVLTKNVMYLSFYFFYSI